VFTATIDRAQGAVRLRGRLDRRSADLLYGTVVALRRQGHRQVNVQIPATALEDVGVRRLLDGLAEQVLSDGVRLTVR
jgi:hypothetical protein